MYYMLRKKPVFTDVVYNSILLYTYAAKVAFALHVQVQRKKNEILSAAIARLQLAKRAQAQEASAVHAHQYAVCMHRICDCSSNNMPMHMRFVHKWKGKRNENVQITD